MFERFIERVQRLADAGGAPLLRGGRVGLEKESLRVRPDGRIADTPHPAALGAALTHPFITTDFSEALLEFVTPPFEDARQTLAFLDDIHRFVYLKLGDELLWPASMPCMVGGDESIPLAEYGGSNVGRMKHVYRRGLSLRYGRVMQIIAGVHFNYSVSDGIWPLLAATGDAPPPGADAASHGYFALVRNFERMCWVVPYLFGSSPAVCKSFLAGRGGTLDELDAGTLYRPHATSLRMSDIGYRNSNQRGLGISYDSLDAYVESLTRAIQTPFPDYERLGVRVDGEYRQLNANVLQIENEYYGYIRPKQIARSGERPTLALRRRGVQYVEMRALDIDPFDPLGVDEDSMRFIEMLLLLCLLDVSPPIDAAEKAAIERNQRLVATCGRDRALEVCVRGRSMRVGDCLTRLCEALEPLAALLDEGRDDGAPYTGALERQAAAAGDPGLTRSARVLDVMRERDESFFQFAARAAREHAQALTARPPAADATRRLAEEARRSIEQQAAIEAADQIDFDEYLRRYFAQSDDRRERILG